MFTCVVRSVLLCSLVTDVLCFQLAMFFTYSSGPGQMQRESKLGTLAGHGQILLCPSVCHSAQMEPEALTSIQQKHLFCSAFCEQWQRKSAVPTLHRPLQWHVGCLQKVLSWSPMPLGECGFSDLFQNFSTSGWYRLYWTIQFQNAALATVMQLFSSPLL